jgi:hypothetical protein
MHETTACRQTANNGLLHLSAKARRDEQIVNNLIRLLGQVAHPAGRQKFFLSSSSE